MNKRKVKVEVFVPLGSCICNFAPLMEKVGHITTKYKDVIELQVKSTKSSEASEYGIQDTCIVVDGKIKLPSEFDEKELEEVILKKRESCIY